MHTSFKGVLAYQTESTFNTTTLRIMNGDGMISAGMKRIFSRDCLLLLTCLTIGGVARSRASKSNVCSGKDGECEASILQEVPCGVYMAPSTIGEANMGIYTANDLPANVAVNFPEIAIPLMFRDWGDHGDNPDGSLWDRYVWEGTVADLESYQDENRDASKAVFVPGIGCTVNSILEMNNIISTHGSIYDTAGLHRSRDPGVGAFSPYHSSKTITKEPVRAGAELFASYGDYWIPWIPGAVITLNENLDNTDEFVEEYADWVKGQDLPPDVKEGLWNFTKDFPYYSKVFTALPKRNWSRVEEVVAEKPTSITRRFIREDGVRDLQWLKDNGKCQDHIRPGRSTLTQAGRGAFATRFLPKGTVVGYAPLIHVGNARYIFNISYNVSGTVWHNEDIIINYSFGHPNSTVVLTPYGGMVNYINHHKQHANVRVQWPEKELIAHRPEWLKKDVSFLSNLHGKIGLSFDYVALRDIQEGEEIFMDYGDEWEKAWQEHVAKWKPLDGSESYVHSKSWPESFLRTVEELQSNPYPSNLHTMCFRSFRQEASNTFSWIPVLRKDNQRVHCRVLRRFFGEGETFAYDVEMLLSATERIVVKNVPGDGIFLYDKANSTDWHMPNVFRHEIMIPDDLFPPTWANGR